MLIRTNALSALVEADVGSTPVTDKWPEISRLLTERCGGDVAALFAEPSISRSNGASESIARWYSDADGPAVSFSALDADSRATVSAHLTSVLSRLDPLLRDPAASALIGPAVQIPSMADVMVVGGRPVIVNWGFLPQDIAASPARRDSHFRTTLGQFLPGISVPPFGAARALAATPAPVAPIATPAAATVAPAVVTQVAAAETSRYRPWLPVGIATLVALLALLILLIPGVLIYPDQNAITADDIELRRQQNRALEEHVERLKKQLAEAVCTPQNPGGAPQRSTPAPAAPSTPGSTTPTPTTPAPSTTPDKAVPDKQGAAPAPAAPSGEAMRALSNTDLLTTLEKSTVLVLIVSSEPEGGLAGIGSGFFINDRQIVTNRHVAAAPKAGHVFVVSKALTQPLEARVIALSAKTTSPPREDFALLELAQPVGVAGLALSTGIERLNAVTTAGFPGTLVRGDTGFAKLLKGDSTAMPEMAVTQGVVTVIQPNNGAPLVYHTATITGGNSGGPLADACGRVVAINTFTRTDSDRPIAFNGALGGAAVAAFLEASNVRFTKVAGACESAR